ncbi:MAG: hypothetical protein WCP06_13750 [Verrucomicrobiota bacterium]
MPGHSQIDGIVRPRLLDKARKLCDGNRGAVGWGFRSLESLRLFYFRPLYVVNIVGTAIGTPEAMADMSVMAAAPGAIQSVVSALKSDVPSVDWQSTLKETMSNPETFFAALPFALVGAGYGSWKESRVVAKAMADPTSLRYQGNPGDH